MDNVTVSETLPRACSLNTLHTEQRRNGYRKWHHKVSLEQSPRLFKNIISMESGQLLLQFITCLLHGH